MKTSQSNEFSQYELNRTKIDFSQKKNNNSYLHDDFIKATNYNVTYYIGHYC